MISVILTRPNHSTSLTWLTAILAALVDVQALGTAPSPDDAAGAARTASIQPAPSQMRTSIRGHPVSDVLDSTLWNRELGSVSEEVVTALVHQLFHGIRDYLVQAAEMKFNCFFLMPVVDAFPTKLREELEAAYESNLEEVFDVDTVRASRLYI
jgi:hypothetical protein